MSKYFFAILQSYAIVIHILWPCQFVQQAHLFYLENDMPIIEGWREI